MRTALHTLLRQSAAMRPDAPALTHKSSSLTYGALWRQSAALAAGLRGLGLARGDRCAVFLDKRPETVATIFAVSAAAGVFVPVNPVLKAPQVAHILDDCAVKVLVTSRERLAMLSEHLPLCKSLEHIVLVGPMPVEDERQHADVRSWDDLCTTKPEHASEHVIDVDMAAILYTSGSTGSPKGVVLSHRNLLVGAESVGSYLENGPEDVILSVLPLSFDAADQITTAFAVGAHVILLNYLLPGDVPRLCAQHRVTGLTAVPPLWIQIAGLDWPEEARKASPALLRQHRRQDAASHAGAAANDLPCRETFPHVRADGGLPVDLSPSLGGRPPPGLHREGDP